MATKEQWEKVKERRTRGVQYCPGCKEEKLWSNFNKCNSKYPFKLCTYCKLCDSRRKSAASKKKYLSLNDAEKKIYNKRKGLRRFKLTLEEYEIILKQQNFCCAICKNKEDIIHDKTKDIRKLSVDHDHRSKKIRGLLCSRCNSAIGLFKESIEIMEAAILYLKTNNQPTSIKDSTVFS